jgi:hypothetical protein
MLTKFQESVTFRYLWVEHSSKVWGICDIDLIWWCENSLYYAVCRRPVRPPSSGTRNGYLGLLSAVRCTKLFPASGCWNRSETVWKLSARKGSFGLPFRFVAPSCFDPSHDIFTQKMENIHTEISLEEHFSITNRPLPPCFKTRLDKCVPVRILITLDVHLLLQSRSH